MIKFKSGVRLGKENYDWRVFRILLAADETSPEGYTPTITAATDGKHMENSLHYSGKAFDIRVKDYPSLIVKKGNTLVSDSPELWTERIKHYLGKDYDVIIHGQGIFRHIHAEYDPK